MKQPRHLFPLVFWLVAAASSPAAVRYVNVNSANPSPPYTNWATAATTIQDAVDGAVAGDQVLVTNGVYQTGGRAGLGRVVVPAFMAVQSVNGPAFTVISGGGVERCALLENGSLLSGFTLTNGFGSSGSGGGVAFANFFSDAVVSNCFITGNSASTGGGASSALVTGGNTPVGGTLSHCVLSNNSATGFQPGNPTIGIGGGADNCTLISCVLMGNSGNWDGGGASASTLTNCLLVGNSSGAVGGAIWSTLVNCTVSGNSGSLAGGTYNCDVKNSIVYYNSEPNHFSNRSTTNTCTTPLPESGSGNITNAPLFVDTNNWVNLRLQSNSPCMNAGNNAAVPGSTDLDGRPRIVGSTVDMGAYEFQPGVSGEFIGWLSGYGLSTDGSADYSDTDRDLANNWQEWIAGTVPVDAASVLRLLVPSKDPSGITLCWQSVSNRLYRLERAAGLGTEHPFSILSSNIAGQPGTTSYTDTNTFGSSPFFYRIGVQQ